MKFEHSPYDPNKKNTEGGLLVRDGNEVTGEFEILKTEFEDEATPETTVDEVLTHVADGEAEEALAQEEIGKPIHGTEKLQSEIQSGINELRQTIERKGREKRVAEETEAHDEDEMRTAQKAEVSRSEVDAYAEDIARDEAKLEEARLKWQKEVSEGQETHKKQQEDLEMRSTYEELRAHAFNRISPLEQAIKDLSRRISHIQNELVFLHEKEEQVRGINPESYEQVKQDILAQEELLRENQYIFDKRQTMLDRVSTFEHKLWGDFPDELFKNSEVLWANINNCESRKEFVQLFDTWGALPGVDVVSKPLTNKEEVERFLSGMDGKSSEELHDEATRLFENVHLRNLVLELPKREQEQEAIKAEGEAKKIEEITAKLRKGAHFSREAVPHHAERELDSLEQEEQDLTLAKPILESKLFRFAPFLMNITKGGREKLSLLRRAGLDKNAVGTGNKNLELARVFRLKAVREKEAAMKGQVQQRFADDLDRRDWSEDREFYDSQHPFTERSTDSIKDRQRLERGDTRQKNVRGIRRSLTEQGSSDSFLERIVSSFFGGGKAKEITNGPTYRDIITPDQIAKNPNPRVVEGVPERKALSEADIVRAKMRNMEEGVVLPKEELDVYTEAPKKEKIKKETKVKTTGKPKKRSPKKRLL